MSKGITTISISEETKKTAKNQAFKRLGKGNLSAYINYLILEDGKKIAKYRD